MQFAEMIATQDVLDDLRVTSKARLLRELADHGGRRTGIASEVILRALMQREELGSTGLGDGIAIPHTRLAGIAAPFGILAHLRSPIAFDAVDDKSVDLVVLLLLPERESGRDLNALAWVARRLRDTRVTSVLRSARGHEALRDAFLSSCAEKTTS